MPKDYAKLVVEKPACTELLLFPQRRVTGYDERLEFLRTGLARLGIERSWGLTAKHGAVT